MGKNILKIIKSKKESIYWQNENTELLTGLTFINFLKDRLERLESWLTNLKFESLIQVFA